MFELPTTPSASDPQPGHVVAGRYRITALLGEGGMATVYRAEQDAEPHEVAVKLLHPQLARDSSFVSRFKREAAFAMRAAHPNIVRVLDFGCERDTHYLVMELLRGEDLFDRLARERRLDAREAVEIMTSVCSALAAAHGEGIVHRDLKPENVFLAEAPDGARVVKVLDFGIARMLEPPTSTPGWSTPNLTLVGTVLGTPEFMSPEQCRAEMPGPRSDVYACGALLYAMLTGRPPFVAANPVEVAARHVGEIPAAPSTLRADIHPRLEAVILKALAKDPRERHAGALALAEDLQGALAPQVAAAPEGCASSAPAVAARAASSTVALPVVHEDRREAAPGVALEPSPEVNPQPHSVPQAHPHFAPTRRLLRPRVWLAALVATVLLGLAVGHACCARARGDR